MQWRSTVQRENGSKPKGFTPQTLQARVGDAIFWFNEDHKTPHQPYPTTPPGKLGDWGPVIGGQNSSQQLNLNQAGTYLYQCHQHPDERATIIVANAVVIGPSGTGAATVAPAKFTMVAGQCVSWGNSDGAKHQPTPDQGNPWFTQPILPGDISAQIPLPSAGIVLYHCALHPNAGAEKGAIVVANAVVIAPSGTVTPSALQIVAGQSVMWRNSDANPHQPTPDQGNPWFTNPIASGGISAPIALASAGTVPYHCALHPNAATEKGIINIT